ncbi:MAG: GtrA family protein [bacterium]|nr:GtrA family protein [bacterium]
MKELVSRMLEWRPLRYLLSGGTAAAANLAVLYILVHFFHMWYLEAAVLSFIVGMCVSFVLQKFFTFSHFSTEKLKRQTSLHASLQLVNLVLNTALMYAGVDLLHIPYLLAQFLISAGMAVYSFLFYKYLVFTPLPPPP